MAPVRDKGPQDLNALAFEPDAAHDPTAKHFIPRAGARKRGLEIAFDPSQHKEWVTGFRKRKNERKTAGLKVLEAQAKQERQQQRTEALQKRREQLQVTEGAALASSDDEFGQALAGGHEQATTTYLTNGATTTVTTAAVNLDSHYQRTSKQQRSGENHDDGKAAAAAGAGAAAKADQTGAEAATVAGKAKRTATQRLQQLKNKGGKKKGLQPVRLGKGSKGSKHGKKGGSKRRR